MTKISIIERGWGLNVKHDNQCYAVLITYHYADKTFSTMVLDDKGDDVSLSSELQRIIDDYKKHTILKEI
jgi:hypothetical protein